MRHPKRGNSPKLPDFPLEDVADAYTHYVLNLGIPEETFWDADVWFVREIAQNKAAYEMWYADALERMNN